MNSFSIRIRLFLLAALLSVAGVLPSPTPLSAQSSDGVMNAPQTYEEALVGTGLPMLPTTGGSLIDAGTADAIRGLPNLVGPFLGSAPDVGAYELGLGVPWTGPRSFGNLIAYGVPKGWQTASMSDLSRCGAVGLPASVSANAFRVLLTHSNPDACILATFEEVSGDARWSRLDAIVAGQAGDTELVKRVSFRDGLDARIVKRESTAQFLGGRVDDEGVLNVIAGVAANNLAASASEPGLKIQDDFFTFVRSLWYAWYLQDPQNPAINLAFVTPPAPGVVAVGSAAEPSTGNAVVPGTLRGDVTLTNASIIWDVTGDANLNATATVRSAAIVGIDAVPACPERSRRAASPITDVRGFAVQAHEIRAELLHLPERGMLDAMKHYHFPIVIEQDENGYFATCPSLQGCYTQGETYEEALANIKDAIKLHIEDRHAAKEDIRPAHLVSLSAVDIAV